MATVKWSALESAATVVNAQTINAAAYYLGSEVDNATNKHRWALAELVTTHGTAPTAGKTWDLYLVTAPDGTNYADGDASTTPQYPDRVGSFVVRNVNSAQRRVIAIPLPPSKFKPLLMNNTDQNSSANATTLKLYAYNETVA